MYPAIEHDGDEIPAHQILLLNFQEARFGGGTVDLSQPGEFTHPPRFDDFGDGVPAGLSLPETELPPRE